MQFRKIAGKEEMKENVGMYIVRVKYRDILINWKVEMG